MRLIFAFLFLVNGLMSFAQLEINFSSKGGIYSNPIELTLSTDSISDIYYTIDGSYPNRFSKHYEGTINLEDISIIRAIAYSNGKKSIVYTHSYFLDREYSLPIVSIVSNPSNFWDYGTGIYVKGCCADSTMPYNGANFWKSWEKPCHVELLFNDGTTGFSQDAGMSIFGGYSRMLPQKSIAIIARKKYGKNRFKYPIFSERKNKKYKSFIVRNSGGDFRKTQFRDAYMTQLVKPTGIEIQAYEPAIVFINGEYFGIQNIREKISEHYLADNFGVDKDNVDILRHNGVKRHGYSKGYKALLKYLRTFDLIEDTNVDSLSKFMDIENFISYNIAEVYSGNGDAGGNIRYFKERTKKSKWRWIFYDLDMGLSNPKKDAYKDNTLADFTLKSNEIWPNPSWSTFIIRSLLANKKLEYRYINTFCDYLNTIFKSDSALGLFDQMAKRIETEIPFHQKRWKLTTKHWNQNLNVVRKFINERPNYLFQHIKERFNLEDSILVKVILPDSNICKFELNTLNLNSNFSGLYFAGVPISVKVNPKHDYAFKGWKGRKETDINIEITSDKDIVLEPIFELKELSNYKDKIILNEISFSQIESDSSDDWIELYNRSESKIDLTGWRMTKSSFKKGYKLAEKTIEAHSFIVLSRKEIVKGQFNDLDFGISKEGEYLKLYDAEGFVVDDLVISDRFFNIDSTFTYARVHPDSIGVEPDFWTIQKPTIFANNNTYVKMLEAVELRAKIIQYSIVGGVIFFVLIVVLYFRKRRKKLKTEA